MSRANKTTDSRKLIWNDDLEVWEMLQHDRNASGWGNSATVAFGPETSLSHALLRRDGIDEVYVIKCASSGASYGPDTGTVSSWEGDEDNLLTITATATVTPVGNGATITAAAGTFSDVAASMGIEITGSLFIVGTFSEPDYLGQVVLPFATLSPRRSGNNTYRNKPLMVLSVSGDGSEISVNNTAGSLQFEFHAETRSFTFRFGKFSLRRMAEETVARAMASLRMEMRLSPQLILTADQSGDNDTATDQDTFTAQVVSHASWMREQFGVDEDSATCPPHAVVKTSPHIFLGTDEGLAGVIAGQDDAVDQINNAFAVETHDLPIRFESNGDATSPWPPIDRGDNGVHLTSSASITIGWRIANGFDRFSFVPELTGATEINAAGNDYFQEASAVELIVEDGTGLEDANSYASVEFGDDYFAAFSGSTAWDDAELATKESALRAATQYIDLRYGDRFIGFRLQSGQALAAPRTMAFASDGRTITGIPVELEKATVEAAVRWIQDPTQLLPDVAAGSNVESRSVDVGGIRIGKTFQGGATTSKSFPIVDRLLRQSGLMISGNWVSV